MFSSARPKSPWTAGLIAFLAIPLALVAGCSAVGAAPGSSAASSSKSSFTIGFALSQSGDMAPFDVEPGKAALLRVKQINAEGGINGTKIKTVVDDVRSDPNTVGTVATQLISQGANLLILPCDFDLSAQGAVAAQSAHVPAISICAGDPKMADNKTIGDYVYTGGAGSDVEGAAGADWAIGKGWKTAYLLQDESIEYTKSAGRYFAAEFRAKGGTIIGSGEFPGGANVDISSQIAHIRSLPKQPAFIYDASWNPAAATAIRQLREAGVTTPVIGPAALDGKVLTGIVGSASNIYYTAFACYVYCSGEKSPALASFVTSYVKAYGAAPSSSYALAGYDLISAVADAARHAKSFSGPGLRAALDNSEPITTPIGKVQYFSPTCHKIIDVPLTVIGVSHGSMAFVGQQRVNSIPNLHDGNSCAS